MPTPLDKLIGLSLVSIEAAMGSPRWEREMERVIRTAHTAAWLTATAERLGVRDPGLLKRPTRAERADIDAAVRRQLEYLRGFVAARGGMSDAAARARARLYGPAVKSFYYGQRWGDWEIPDQLLPGNQRCLGNCLCRGHVKDNGDGTGLWVREMGGTEANHCKECPPLAGEHPIRRRGYAVKAWRWAWSGWAVKHGAHDQSSHGRRGRAGRAGAAAYRGARAGGASVSEARAAGRAATAAERAREREERAAGRVARLQTAAERARRAADSGQVTPAQRQALLAKAENLEARARGERVPNRRPGRAAPLNEPGIEPTALPVRRFDDAAAGDVHLRAAMGGLTLTAAEQDALDFYQGGAFTLVNGRLRGTSPWAQREGTAPDRVDGGVAGLDSVMGRSRTRENLESYRGMVFSDRDAASWEFAQRLQPGATFRDDGFMSTTIDRQVIQGFSGSSYGEQGPGRIAMDVRVRVPAGTPAIYYNALRPDGNPDERELLLGRGLTYRVIGRRDLPGGVSQVDIEVLP
jgi:hypothetical protein